jgi:hypothetical protein
VGDGDAGSIAEKTLSRYSRDARSPRIGRSARPIDRAGSADLDEVPLRAMGMSQLKTANWARQLVCRTKGTWLVQASPDVGKHGGGNASLYDSLAIH